MQKGGKEREASNAHAVSSVRDRTQTEMVSARKQSASAAEKAVTQAVAQLNQAKQRAEQVEKNSPRQIQVQTRPWQYGWRN